MTERSTAAPSCGRELGGEASDEALVLALEDVQRGDGGQHGERSGEDVASRAEVPITHHNILMKKKRTGRRLSWPNALYLLYVYFTSYYTSNVHRRSRVRGITAHSS
jgi:hypothetical protein